MLNFSKSKSPINDVDLKSKYQLLQKQLDVVQVVSAQLINQTKLDETLTTIVKGLGVKLGYINPVIYLLDETKDSYSVRKVNVPQLVVGLVEQVVGKSIYDVKFKITDDNLIAKSIKSGETQVSDNFYALFKPYLNESTAKIAQTTLRISSVIISPVKVENNIIGCLSVGSKNREPTLEEIKIIQTFADQISIAIFNSQQNELKQNQLDLLTKKNRDLESLYNLTSKISSTLDPKMVAQNAVDSLPQNRSMIGAVLGRYDEFKKDITVIATSRNQFSYQVEKLIGDFSQYKIQLEDPKFSNSLSVKVVKTRQPHHTTNLAEYLSPPIPKQFMGMISNILQIKSVAAYPVISRGRVIGVLGYLLREKDFTELEENEKQLLTTYTNQIAIALDNANLYSASQEIQRNLEKALAQIESIRRHERDMIDIMGHELRTPMSIVRNALVMMDMQMKTNEEQPVNKVRKYVDMALDSARREVTLIETLLSATKTDGKGFQLLLEKVNLTEVVNESLKAFETEAQKKGLKVKFTDTEEPVLIYGDRTRIQEISDNFISNAVKYTLKGSVEITISKDKEFGFVSVKDSGIGISEEDLKRLGEKFFRARQYIDDQFVSENEGEEDLEVVRPGGTGLGLYVTFNLIRIMDGKLDIKSKIKEGSTFTFGIPLYNGQPVKQVERKSEEDQ